MEEREEGDCLRANSMRKQSLSSLSSIYSIYSLLLQLRNAQDLVGIYLVGVAEHRLVGFEDDAVLHGVVIDLFRDFRQRIARLHGVELTGWRELSYFELIIYGGYTFYVTNGERNFLGICLLFYRTGQNYRITFGFNGQGFVGKTQFLHVIEQGLSAEWFSGFGLCGSFLLFVEDFLANAFEE